MKSRTSSELQGLQVPPAPRLCPPDQWHPNANDEIALERSKYLSETRDSSSLDSQYPKTLNSNDPRPPCPLNANRSKASSDFSLKRRCDRMNNLVPRGPGDSRPANLQPPKASDVLLLNCQEDLTEATLSRVIRPSESLRSRNSRHANRSDTRDPPTASASNDAAMHSCGCQATTGDGAHDFSFKVFQQPQIEDKPLLARPTTLDRLPISPSKNSTIDDSHGNASLERSRTYEASQLSLVTGSQGPQHQQAEDGQRLSRSHEVDDLPRATTPRDVGHTVPRGKDRDALIRLTSQLRSRSTHASDSQPSKDLDSLLSPRRSHNPESLQDSLTTDCLDLQHQRTEDKRRSSRSHDVHDLSRACNAPAHMHPSGLNNAHRLASDGGARASASWYSTAATPNGESKATAPREAKHRGPRGPRDSTHCATESRTKDKLPTINTSMGIEHSPSPRSRRPSVLEDVQLSTAPQLERRPPDHAVIPHSSGFKTYAGIGTCAIPELQIRLLSMPPIVTILTQGWHLMAEDERRSPRSHEVEEPSIKLPTADQELITRPPRDPDKPSTTQLLSSHCLKTDDDQLCKRQHELANTEHSRTSDCKDKSATLHNDKLLTLQDLHDKENFLSFTNITDIRDLGEIYPDDEPYQAAKLLFTSSCNWARLATTLIYLGKTPFATGQEDLARYSSANSPATNQEPTTQLIRDPDEVPTTKASTRQCGVNQSLSPRVPRVLNSQYPPAGNDAHVPSSYDHQHPNASKQIAFKQRKDLLDTRDSHDSSTWSPDGHQGPGYNSRLPWSRNFPTPSYLHDKEDFLGFTNVADILGIGENCLSDEPCQTTKLLFTSISNWARLASTLIYPEENPFAIGPSDLALHYRANPQPAGQDPAIRPFRDPEKPSTLRGIQLPSDRLRTFHRRYSRASSSYQPKQGPERSNRSSLRSSSSLMGRLPNDRDSLLPAEQAHDQDVGLPPSTTTTRLRRPRNFKISRPWNSEGLMNSDDHVPGRRELIGPCPMESRFPPASANSHHCPIFSTSDPWDKSKPWNLRTPSSPRIAQRVLNQSHPGNSDNASFGRLREFADSRALRFSGMEDNLLVSPIFNCNNPLRIQLASTSNDTVVHLCNDNSLATRQNYILTLAMSIDNWTLMHDCIFTIGYHGFKDIPEFFSRLRILVQHLTMNWPPDSLREITTINCTPASTDTADNREATNTWSKHLCKSALADKDTMVQTIASAGMAEIPYDGNTLMCYHVRSVHPTFIQRQTTEGPKTPAQLQLASPRFPCSPDPRHSRIGGWTQDKRFSSTSRLWQDPIVYAAVLQSDHDRTRSEPTRHYSPMPSQMHEDASIILPPREPHPAQGHQTCISQVIGRSYVDYSSIYPPGYMLNIC